MDFKRYLPDFVNRRFAEADAPPSEVGGEVAECAVLWCDISNFTPLTERLVSADPAGVEALTGYLNRYYGTLVSLIHAHGGDVVQFEGDALLAVWPRVGGGSAVEETMRAVQCSRAIQARLHGFPVSEGVALSQRVAIGVGPMEFHWVGGVLSRWTLVAAGEPLRQVQAIDHDVPPGHIAIAAAAWSLVQGRCVGTRLPSGATRLDAVRAPVPVFALPRVESSKKAQDALGVFLPGAVLSRVGAGLGRWLAELRTVSVLFVHMPGLAGTGDGCQARLHAIAQQIQHAVYRWGGSLNKFSLANKGATLLAGFGVPPLAHEDDPLRAVRAGLDVIRRLAVMGVSCGVGVTTGRVFCGLLGGEDRAEYTTLGRPVNLASRLMGLEEGQLLCDEATWRGSSGRLLFEALTPVKVKGFSALVPVYRATGEQRQVERPQTELIGRTDEMAAISERLQEVLRLRSRQLLVVQGEAGIGKSRLSVEVIAQARALGMRVLKVEAFAIERENPHFAWRALIGALIGCPEGDRSERRAAAERTLAAEEDRAAALALLDEVLPLGVEVPPHIAQLSSEVRAVNLAGLVSRMVRRVAERHPLLLFVEDAHWLDSASWRLLEWVAGQVSPLFTLVATRPFYERGVPESYERLVAAPDAAVLGLEGLSGPETLELVCQRLQAVNLPQAVSDLLVARAGGNPFFAEELAFSLRDAGSLLIEEGTCGLAPGVDLSAIDLPTTVQGVVISRVDRLPLAEQMVLKAASVLGREFPVGTLRDIYPAPVEEGPVDMDALLRALVAADFILPDDDTGRRYIFKHALGQDAVYGLMLFAQRRDLHRSVAEWYESNVEDRASVYPLLAHHWTAAEDAPRAVDYLALSGRDAVGRYANREAMSFLERGLRLLEEHPSAVGRGRMTQMEADLVEACTGAGEPELTVFHGERALALLGRPVPRSSRAVPVRLIQQVLLRAWTSFFGKAVVTPEERDRFRRASQIEARLAEHAAFAEQNFRCLLLALRQLNAAQAVGPSAELGRALAVNACQTGAMPMPRIADAWAEEAIEIAGTVSTQDRSWILSRAGCYLMYRARWAEMDAALDESARLARDIQDVRLFAEATCGRAVAMLYRGRFKECVADTRQVRAASKRVNVVQTFAWATALMGHSLTRLGQCAEALASFPEIQEFMAGASTAERIINHGGRGLARLYSGDLEGALRDAEVISEIYVGSRPIAYFTKFAVPNACEIYWHAVRAGVGDTAAAEARLHAAAKTAWVFGTIFLFGAASGHYWRGVSRWLRGKAVDARRDWRVAVRVGRERDCLHDAAMASRALGATVVDAEEAARHRGEGEALLAQMEIAHSPVPAVTRGAG